MDSLRFAVQGKKVKKLTDRRIKIITAFLKKTLTFPQNYDPFASPAWNRTLLKFLCEARHCKISSLDVKAWLTADCFQQLIHQIREQEESATPKLIQTEYEPVSTSSSSSASSMSSEQPWSNVLEALSLIRRPPQEINSSSSSPDLQSMSLDNLPEEPMPMKTSAAQGLLLLHNNYTDETYDHDKHIQSLSVL